MWNPRDIISAVIRCVRTNKKTRCELYGRIASLRLVLLIAFLLVVAITILSENWQGEQNLLLRSFVQFLYRLLGFDAER